MLLNRTKKLRIMKIYTLAIYKSIFIVLLTLVLPNSGIHAQPLDYKGKISLIASGSGSYVMESGVGIRYFTLETGIYPGYYLTNRFLAFGGFSHFVYSSQFSPERFNINTLSGGGRYYFFKRHSLFLEANLNAGKVSSDSMNFGVLQGGLGIGANFIFVRPTFGGNISLEAVFKFNSELTELPKMTINQETFLDILGTTIGFKYSFPSLPKGTITTKGNDKQPGTTQNLHYIRLINPFNSVFYSYEKAIGSKFSLISSIGLNGLSYLYSDLKGLYVQGMIEPRFVYGIGNRKSRHQVTINNSSDYLGIEFGIRKVFSELNFQGDEDLLITPRWGLRRSITKALFFDINLGGQFTFWQMKSIEFNPIIDFSLNLVILKRERKIDDDL